MTEKIIKKESAKEGRTARVAYDGFRLFPSEEKGVLTAINSINCSCADKVLQGGIGYEYLYNRNGEEIKTAPLKNTLAYYLLEGWANGGGTELTDYYFVLTEDGSIYQYSANLGGYVKKAEVGLQAGIVAAYAPNGETRILVAGENGGYCVDGEDWTEITETDGEKGTSAICFSKNRVFLGERPCKLLYGNPELPWDFTSSYDDGGYAYLPLNKGNIVDITEFGDSIYIFFQRGIMRLKPDGLARNFQLSEAEYSGGEIFAKSVGVCGNWIFFLSENGICRFDGNKVERVGRFLGITPSKSRQNCAHATVGEYFVLRYFDELLWMKRTVALRADGNDGYFLSDFTALNECNRTPLCAVGTRLATLKLGGNLPDGEKRVFESDFISLGGEGKKYLKSVTFYGEGCFAFEVFDGEAWTAFEIEDMIQKKTLKIGLHAEDFRFRFIIHKEAKLRRLVVEYERMG